MTTHSFSTKERGEVKGSFNNQQPTNRRFTMKKSITATIAAVAMLMLSTSGAYSGQKFSTLKGIPADTMTKVDMASVHGENIWISRVRSDIARLNIVVKHMTDAALVEQQRLNSINLGDWLSPRDQRGRVTLGWAGYSGPRFSGGGDTPYVQLIGGR